MPHNRNKKIARVVLDDLTRETTHRCFAERSAFEGHMVDYATSPIRKESVAQREARENDARSEMRRAGKALIQIYPDGNSRAIKSITAEGERVVAEYFVHAGRTIFDPDLEHNFHVLKILEFDDGEIVRMREYCDSAYLRLHAGPIAEFMHRTQLTPGAEIPPATSAWSSDWCLAEPPAYLESDDAPPDDGRLAANKAATLALSQRWGTPEMGDLLHDDVFFNNEIDVAVSPELGQGIRGREQLVSIACRSAAHFGGTLRRTVTAVTAESNRVVVEEEVTGTDPRQAGKPFRTRVAKICLLGDGKAFRIRQYLDSAFVQASMPGLAAYIFGAAAKPPQITEQH